MSLLIILKMIHRFHANFDGNTFDKKQNFVHFPINDLKITDYITPSLQKQNRFMQQYYLFAVSNHYGTMNRGHYTAFCKNSKSKTYAFYKQRKNISLMHFLLLFQMV